MPTIETTPLSVLLPRNWTRQALLPLRPQAGPRSHTEHPGGEEKREVPTGWSRLKRHQAWGLRAHAPRGNATTAVQAGLREHGRWLPGAGAPTQPGTTSSRAWISQVPSRGDKLQVTELPTPPPPPRLALPRLQASLLKPTAVSRWGLGTRATLRPHFSGRPPPPKPVTPGTPPTHPRTGERAGPTPPGEERHDGPGLGGSRATRARAAARIGCDRERQGRPTQRDARRQGDSSPALAVGRPGRRASSSTETRASAPGWEEGPAGGRGTGTFDLSPRLGRQTAGARAPAGQPLPRDYEPRHAPLRS